MKLLSWNVNGIRAVERKNAIAPYFALDADVLCLQETKATVDQTKEVLKAFPGYEVYGNEALRKGYSGTALITRVKPLSVTYNIGIHDHDQEGRVINAEFNDFYFITTYVPNSGSELLRLDYRQQWDRDLLAYIKKLEKTKPVIICGDLNVAHKAIDLARPKENYNKAAGHMQQEIDGMDNYQNAGLIDTFRYLNPEVVKYSWWSQRAGAREKNVGWRIDYFLASQSLKDRLKEAHIHNDIHGSDHCPVGLILH